MSLMVTAKWLWSENSNFETMKVKKRKTEKTVWWNWWKAYVGQKTKGEW